MSACTAEPISWLRLERHALGELDAAEAAAIDAHLTGCPACRGCRDQIRGDDRPLPRLVLPEPAPRRRWWPVWAGAALAAAAALLLFLWPRGGATPEIAGPRVAIKGGGDLVVAIIREPGGDRFKVQVTCAPPTEVHADVVVFQDGGASFPLAPARLRCGNLVVLPGAFRMTRATPAVVCLAIDADRPLDRDALARRGPRGAGLGCVQLAP